jgi:purine-binding chemotaxis protein CheW
MPPDETAIEAILRRRAAQLAQSPPEGEHRDDVEVLICRLGTERYAMQTADLRAVQWTPTITPVPSTPETVLGIVSVRGEIVTLLDLRRLLGLPAAPDPDGPRPALLLGLPGLRAGLVVDEVLGVERLTLADLQPSLSGREFTRGLTADGIILLDLGQLMASARFETRDDGL